MERWQINFYNKLKRSVASGDRLTVKASQATIVLTNHTKKTKDRFSNMQNSFELFHLINKIKSYIDELPEDKNYRAKNIECIYNYSNPSFNYFGKEKIYAMDVSSCYITIAKNTGLISNELFLKAKSMKKEDRLKLMGLLAYKPIISEYENKELIKSYIQKNEYAEYFFFLVKETDKIFIQLMNKLKYAGAFFWVDCVFFKGEENINLVSDFLKSKKLKFTISRCFKFNHIKNETFDKYSMFKFDGKKEMQYKEYCPSVLNSHEKNKRNELLQCIFRNDFRGMLDILNKNKNES